MTLPSLPDDLQERLRRAGVTDAEIFQRALANDSPLSLREPRRGASRRGPGVRASSPHNSPLTCGRRRKTLPAISARTT
jgi:hypothetical protein